MRKSILHSFMVSFAAAALASCATAPPQIDTTSPEPGGKRVQIGQQPSTEALSKYSRFVIVGNVIKGESYWRGKKIVTDWKIEVVRNLKGDAPKRVTVTTLGGAVPPFTQYATHSPRLREGETAILFLSSPDAKAGETGIENLVITGGEYGKLPLLRPGQAKSRLKNNRRLTRYVDSIAQQVR